MSPGHLELDLAHGVRRVLLDGATLDGHAVVLARVPDDPQTLGAAGLAGPAGIAVDAAGNVYVADAGGHRVLRVGACDRTGVPLRCVTGPGSAPGQVDSPSGVAVGPRDRLFVADNANDRVLAFELHAFQLVGVIEPVAQPGDLACDSAGGLYVIERASARVLKFDIDARPLPFADTVATQPRVPADPVSVAIALIDDLEQAVILERDGSVLVYDLDGVYDDARADAWSAAVVAALAGAAPAAIAVGADRIYVGAPGGVLTFALDGTFLGRAGGYRGDIASLALDAQGRLVVHPGAGDAVRLEGAGVVPDGSARIGPIAAGDGATDWQRIHLDAQMPAGAQVQLYTLTTDADGDPPPLPASAPVAPPEATPPDAWRAAPPGNLDVLALNAPARFLWLGVRLHASDNAGPRVTAARVAFDQPGWLPLLPAVYARDDDSRVLLERLLALTESALADEEQLLDRLPELLGAASAPDDDARWLDWLASWVAFDLEDGWSEDARRAAVAGAFELNGRRGTASGLRDLIRLALGLDVRVREPQASLWALGDATLGFTTMLTGGHAQGAVLGSTATLNEADLVADEDLGVPLFEELASRFCVDVRVADLRAPGALDALRRLIERERPAETVGHICVIGPRARVGAQAQVGVDAIVGGPPSPLRAGAGALGSDTVLSPRPGPARIDDALRVGQTTRLT